MPGEVFVHRNVANVVVHTDLNCLSVLQYAVDVLKVEHVIVRGHYTVAACVQAAWRGASLGLIDNWLRHVKDVAEKYAEDIAARPDDETRVDRLCELTCHRAGVRNVASTTIVQDAWRRGQAVSLHGWAYRLQSGLLKEIGVRLSSEKDLMDFISQRVMPGALF